MSNEKYTDGYGNLLNEETGDQLTGHTEYGDFMVIDQLSGGNKVVYAFRYERGEENVHSERIDTIYFHDAKIGYCTDHNANYMKSRSHQSCAIDILDIHWNKNSYDDAQHREQKTHYRLNQYLAGIVLRGEHSYKVVRFTEKEDAWINTTPDMDLWGSRLNIAQLLNDYRERELQDKLDELGI